MRASLNQVESLGQKAARGAGAYPAQAAHFGRALVCHLAAGRAVSSLEAALGELPKGPIQTAPVSPESCQDPNLAQSFREAMAAPDQRPTVPDRIDIPDALRALLLALAQNTYVPSTDASRSAGAGAGLSDND